MRRRIAVLFIALISMLSVLPAGASVATPDSGDGHLCVRSDLLFGTGRGICLDWNE